MSGTAVMRANGAAVMRTVRVRVHAALAAADMLNPAPPAEFRAASSRLAGTLLDTMEESGNAARRVRAPRRQRGDAPRKRKR